MGFAGAPFDGGNSLDRAPSRATCDQAGQTKCPPNLFKVTVLGSGGEPQCAEMVDRPDEEFFGMIGHAEAVTAPVAHKHDTINVDEEERAIHRPA